MFPEVVAVHDTNFKDDSPLNTVERIKGILKSYGMETQETWSESGVPYCYSLRVSVFGTEFGTNGKGVTKELALASAYGELMERLQIGSVLKSGKQTGDNLNDGSLYGSVPAQGLLAKNKPWYSLYANKVEKLTGCKLTEEDILKQYCDEKGNVPVTPFYCVNSRSHGYLPTKLVEILYTTNGCAAGNTMEEAIVQAISEVVERNHSERILLEGIAVPDIPEEVLHSCTIAYEIITFLRNHNFHVIVKDCSLETKFPVVCVCLIDKKTGKYHSHFGAYPNFEIALQRTLTESFQGRNIQKIGRFDNFARGNVSTINVGNIVNQLVKGTAERHPEFFMGSSAPYCTEKGFSGTSNRDLLKECIEFFGEQGYDVLVRDCSCLGFPACQVIVPGYSEAFAYRLDPKHNDLRYHKYAAAVLANPSSATMEELMGFMMNLNESKKRKLVPKPFSQQANLPATLSNAEERYFMNAAMAHVSYTMGRQADAVKYIDQMLLESVDKDEEHLICVKRYLNLRADGYEESKIRTILEFFHKPETVEQLYAAVSENRNLLDPFAVRCDMKCDKTCLLYGACRKEKTEALAQLIRSKMREMNNSALEKQLASLL